MSSLVLRAESLSLSAGFRARQSFTYHCPSTPGLAPLQPQYPSNGSQTLTVSVTDSLFIGTWASLRWWPSDLAVQPLSGIIVLHHRFALLRPTMMPTPPSASWQTGNYISWCPVTLTGYGGATINAMTWHITHYGNNINHT